MTKLSMKKNLGFSLIELLVAMGVTMVVLAATMVAFKDGLRANQNVTLNEDMTENMRAGLNMMQQDLILAGTGIPTGGISIPATSDGNPTPCNIGAPINRPAPDPTAAGMPAAAPIVFQTTQATGGASTRCNFYMPAIEPGPGYGPVIAMPDGAPTAVTDMITVLYSDNSLGLADKLIYAPAVGANPGCPAGAINTAGNVTTVAFDPTCVNIGAAGITVSPGDLIMFSNAKGNVLQTVSDVSAAGVLTFNPGDAFNLNGRADPQGTMTSIQNTDAAGNPLVPASYPPTTATRIWMITYYLDNLSDPTHARLVRRVNFQRGQPVGETIETLNFFYNFSDGTATPPVNQSGVPIGVTENNIRSLNINLGARSSAANGQNNRYMRSNLRTQVSFRSMAFVNRYPTN